MDQEELQAWQNMQSMVEQYAQQGIKPGAKCRVSRSGLLIYDIVMVSSTGDITVRPTADHQPHTKVSERTVPVDHIVLID